MATYLLYGCIGSSVGYHRYYSHRAFLAARWVEAMFIVLGVLACIGTPAGWIVMHRRHHAYSDRDGAPHRTAVLLLIDPLAPVFLWAVPVALTLWSGSVTNYLCHKWGDRAHETSDDSRNNWPIALLHWGEGWHNNQHARPDRASFAEAWWHIDIGGWVCAALALTGLRRDKGGHHGA